MSTIRLAVLGPLAITRDQQPIELKIAKVQALLAYLAVTRVPHSRDHLLALLWAESHPDAARKNLRNRLWQLRQALGEEVLVTTGDQIALAPTVWTDVAAFEAGFQTNGQVGSLPGAGLSPPLHLWRGPLLADVHLTEAPDFELWVTAERERFGQLYLRGLQAALADRQRAADWPQVITLARQGLAYDPLQESLHHALMNAYAHQGARTEALRQYDQLQALLTQELGVAPLPETDTLRQAIANHQFGSQSRVPFSPVAPLAVPITNGNVPSSSIPDKTATRSSPLAAPFIGRQAQLATLELALQQASRGQCKVVLVSGELGIGKTRLWQSWAATLASETVVLETRCLNTTQAVPFDPIRRLLSSGPCRTHFATVAGELLPIWRAELLRVAPALQQGAGSLPGAQAATPAEEGGLVAEALTQFLRTFGANPLIFFLDDLHWADEATLNWLLYLTDRMAHEPLLLVGAYRPEDASALLTRLVAQWQREDVLQRMPLPPLTRAEATTLLATLGRQVTQVDHFHSQSGGNPYYLTQLGDSAVDGIPTTLADLVQARLTALPAPLQPILQAAAVLEPAIDVDILQQTSGRTTEETLDALDGLLAAGVLVERADAYEFAHPLVAAVVRNGLNSGRRKLLHRRAATGLATRYADQLATVAGQLVRHYEEAGAPREAAHFAEMAGEEALRIGAATEAVAFFQQAHTLASTPLRQLGLGRALMFLPGKMAEARATMQAALIAFEAQGDTQGVVKAGLYLAGSHLSTSDGAQVLYWARRVLPDLETVADVTLHASAHYLMGTAKFRSGYALREAATHYSEATRLATEHQLASDIALMSWFEWGNLELEAGEYAGAIAKFQQAHQVAQTGHSVLFEALSLNNLAYATLLIGDLTAAQRFIDTGLALVARYGLQPPQQYFYSTRGEIALAAGRLAEATTAFQQALALAEKYDNPTFAANVRAHLGRVAQARGALDEAYTLLATAKASIAGDTALYLQSQIDLWLAELHVQRADDAAAAASLQLAEARLRNGQNRILQQKAATIRARLRLD